MGSMRRHSSGMKKLLFLLPLMALASCSGGHDLMSDKAFQMTCPFKHPTAGTLRGLVASVSPLLDKATVSLEYTPTKYPGEIYDVEVTPTTIILQERDPFISTTKILTIINRQTGEVRNEEYDLTLSDSRPLKKEVADCSFQSL